MPQTRALKPVDQDWQAVAERYQRDVLSGAIVAGKKLRQAIERQVRDIARQNTPAFNYQYDPERGAHACRFLSRLKHVEGELAGSYYVMHPAHVWFVMTAYSWLKPNRMRRFSRLYYEVARGNAKSFLSSGLSLYHLCADNDPGAQVYSAATTLKQAKTVWRVSKAMAAKSKALQSYYGLQLWAHSLTVPRTESKFEAIAAKADTQDGLNISFVVVDEVHAHKTRDLYDVLVTAMGKREQSMMLAITTAGFNLHGIGMELHKYASRVLSGDVEDESQFAVIYSLDVEDDWRDPAVLPKANPLWGYSVKPDKLLELQAQAVATPAAQANFKTKHCNVWVQAGRALFDAQAWQNNADPSLRLEDFKGERCWIGLDLASKRDIASVALVFKRDGKRVAFSRNYLNQQAVEEGRHPSYAAWAEAGYFTLNPGSTTDHSRIEADLLEAIEQFDVAEVGLDPHNATLMAQRLSLHTDVVEVRQTVTGLSEPTKALDAAIRDGSLVHDGSPVTAWAISNVHGYEDKKGCIFPFKDRPENKIDPAIALIVALSRANAHSDDDDDAFNAFIGLKK